MKMFLRCLLPLILLPSVSALAEPVKATVAATRGEVFVNGSKVAAPSSAKAGSTVKTLADSGAILLPVSGETLFIDQKTSLLVAECDMTGASNFGWIRHSRCNLKEGHVHCSIAHAKTGSSSLALVTPQATLTAHGTSWSTWSDSTGMHTAVYAGVVAVSFGGSEISVLPAQVATITGDGDTASLEVLDLRTGIINRYTKGSSSPQSEFATAAQIKAARDLLAAGMGAFRGTAAETDLLAFSQLIDQINQLLAKNQLAPIVPPTEWSLWPNWTKVDINEAPTASSPTPTL